MLRAFLLAAAGGRGRADDHTARIAVRTAVISAIFAEQLASAGDKTIAVPKMTAPQPWRSGLGAPPATATPEILCWRFPVRLVNIFGHQIVIPECPEMVARAASLGHGRTSSVLAVKRFFV